MDARRKAGQIQTQVAAQAPDRRSLGALTQTQTISNPRIEAQNLGARTRQSAAKTQPVERSAAQSSAQTPASPSQDSWLSMLNPASRASYARATAGWTPESTSAAVARRVPGAQVPPAVNSVAAAGQATTRARAASQSRAAERASSVAGFPSNSPAENRMGPAGQDQAIRNNPIVGNAMPRARAPGVGYVTQAQKDFGAAWRAPGTTSEKRVEMARAGENGGADIKSRMDERYAGQFGLSAAQLAAERAKGNYGGSMANRPGVPSRGPGESDAAYEARFHAYNSETDSLLAKDKAAREASKGSTAPVPGTGASGKPTTPGTGGVTGGTGTGSAPPPTPSAPPTTGGAGGSGSGGSFNGGTATAGGNSQSATGQSTSAGSTAAQDYLNSYRQNSNAVGSTAAQNIGDVSGNNNQFVNDSSWFKNNQGSISNNWNFAASGGADANRGSGGDRGQGEWTMMRSSNAMSDTAPGWDRPATGTPYASGGSAQGAGAVSQKATGAATSREGPDPSDPRRPPLGGPRPLFS